MTAAIQFHREDAEGAKNDMATPRKTTIVFRSAKHTPLRSLRLCGVKKKTAKIKNTFLTWE
ncbi:MAG: hypothetical protein ACOZBW_07555 [Thermodesulfobacteriota bacterium]